MIGKKELVYGAQQYIAGQGASDYTPDAGLGNSSLGLNPFISPGIMKGLTLSSDVTTNVASNFIASCEDSNATIPKNRYYVDDAANYYYFNGSTVTKVKTGTATTKYIAGKTDFSSFNGSFYATLTDKIAKWDGSTTLDEAYQTFSDGSAHHPVLIFESLLWFADGNNLHTLSAGGTYTTNVLTLSAKEKIVALGIDPGTGLMLISAQTVYDVSDTIPSLKVVYLYDGYSTKPRRKVIVDDLITAFYNVGGTVYVGAGQTIGYWNGVGVTFLRKLLNVGLDNTELPYKHHFSNLRNVLLVADGATLLAYGEVISGKKGWYNTGYTIATTAKITCVSAVGNNQIGISFFYSVAVAYFLRVFDFSVASSSSCTLHFAQTIFPRPLNIHMIRLITTGLTTTAGIGSVSFYNEKGAQITPAVSTLVVAAADSPKYVFDFQFGGQKVLSLKPVVDTGGQGMGLVDLIVYYDPAE